MPRLRGARADQAVSLRGEEDQIDLGRSSQPDLGDDKPGKASYQFNRLTERSRIGWHHLAARKLR
jgi:hypothetical protein